MPPASTTSKSTTTRPRRTAAKKDEPKPPPQLEKGGGPADDDVIVIPKPDPAAQPDTKPEMVPVFTYDDVTYSMPKTPTAQQSLRAIWELKQHGDLAGGMQVIADVLGEQALQVLLSAPGVDDTHIVAVIDKITDVLFLQGRETTKN